MMDVFLANCTFKDVEENVSAVEGQRCFNILLFVGTQNEYKDQLEVHTSVRHLAYPPLSNTFRILCHMKLKLGMCVKTWLKLALRHLKPHLDI